ncbi:MAG TPA: DeoR/GlpR family DNA-binding transcription regulator [Patescibacteria group bacterium]|nr:DeoR/GlpR family DNA-binding transcription regulator [Patescibacteria group bacterium]
MSDAVTPAATTARARPLAAVDRRHRILERVAEEQTIHVGELAREFDVSEMTIRRDIRLLERDGFVRQTYGGATAHLTRSLDVAFNARALQHTREKRRIGMRATRLLGDARVIYVGMGTTAEQFARFLPVRPGLVAVTASLPIASLLGTRPVEVVALGGSVRRDELTCVGPAAVATLGRYRFDLAVVGAAGVSARWGITEVDDADAEIQRSAIDRADRLVVIADGSKIGGAANAVVADADRIRSLVTDATAPVAELEALIGLGIETIVTGPQDDLAQDAHEPTDHGDPGRAG